MSNFRVCKVAIITGLFFSLFLAGCSENSNPAKSQSDIVLDGKWELTKIVSEYQGVIETYTESQIDSMGLVWTLIMDADGTVEQITNFSGPLVTMPGTWTATENELTLILTGPTGEVGSIVYDYIVDEIMLKLNWELPAGTKMYAELTKR